MDDEDQLVYTLDDALASAGFGKFQFLVLAYAGLGWFAEAMEIMILLKNKDEDAKLLKEKG